MSVPVLLMSCALLITCGKGVSQSHRLSQYVHIIPPSHHNNKLFDQYLVTPHAFYNYVFSVIGAERAFPSHSSLLAIFTLLTQVHWDGSIHKRHPDIVSMPTAHWIVELKLS